MPSWEDELATLDGPSWEDELATLDEPQVGDELGLLPAVAADEARFKPFTGTFAPGSKGGFSGSDTAGEAQWSGDALDSLADMGARASNGMYMGYGDELVGLVGGDQARDNVRNRMQLAQERSPGWSMAGDIAGGAVPAIATGGMAAGATRALPLAGRIAAGGGMAAEQAALSASGYADDGDRGQAALDALPLGFALGGAGEVAATGVQGAGNFAKNWLAPRVKNSGLIDRVASSGRPGQAMEDLGSRQDVIGLGQWMENNGVTGMTPGRVANQVKPIVDDLSGQQGQFVDDMMSRPQSPQVDTGMTYDYLDELASQQDALAPSTAGRLASQYRTEAGNILDQSQLGEGAMSASMPFDVALDNRQAYDDMAKWSKRGDDAAPQIVAKEAAGSLRDGLRASAYEAGPALGQQWEGIQSNLSNALDVQAPSVSREMRSMGESPLSFSTLAGAAGGGIPGAIAGAAVKVGGRGAMADVQRGGSAALDWLGTQATEPMMSMASGAGQTGANQAGRIEGINEKSRGYLLPQAAQQMMQERGALGPYEAKFFEAAGSEDSHALSALIVRLSHTDQRFRQEYLPKLQALTADGSGY